MRLISLLAFATMVLVLPGCETTGSTVKLSDTVVDRTFDKKHIRFRNSLGTPVFQTYYLKLFESDGKLAICGVAVRANSNFMDELWDRWLENASVVIDERSNRITSARFMNMVDEDANPKRARCIQTQRLATDGLLLGRTGLVGSSVTVFF